NFTRMLLPHERDETADRSRAEEPHPEMKQAERDLAAGREDTDCHAQPPQRRTRQEGLTMARCEVCGNDYHRSFEVHKDGRTFTFDSFECAIHRLAPL